MYGLLDAGATTATRPNPLSAARREVTRREWRGARGQHRLVRRGDQACRAARTRARPPGPLLPGGALAPSEIFLPEPKDSAVENRAYKTMEPLITRVSPRLVRNARDDVGGLADSVLASTAHVVVICWEHDALAAWLQRFARRVVVTPDDLPIKWPKGSFDKVWQLQRTLDETHSYAFRERDQLLPVTEVYDANGKNLGFVHGAKFVPQPEPRSHHSLI